jgi:hypothetical protein
MKRKISPGDMFFIIAALTGVGIISLFSVVNVVRLVIHLIS